MNRLKTTLTNLSHRLGKLPLFIKLLLLVSIGAIAWFGSNALLKGDAQPQYQTARVEKGSVVSMLSESGNIVSANQTAVYSTTSGVITEMNVKNGDSVEAGQTLFTVKASATEAQQSSAYSTYLGKVSSLQAAQQNKQAIAAQVQQAQADILSKQAAVENLDTQPTPPTQTERDAAGAALSSAQKNLTAQQTKYSQTDSAIAAASADRNAAWVAYQATQSATITATGSGTIANLTLGVGSNVTASTGGGNSNSSDASSSASTAVMVIGDFSKLFVASQINEVDVPNVKVGQTAKITLDAFSGKTFDGTVDSIDSVGTNTSGVVTYGIRVRLQSSPSGIAASMSATADIEVNRKDNVLRVPTRAITTSGNRSTVRVLQNGLVTVKTIEIGLSDETNTEVTSSISEGETVITSAATTEATPNSSQTTPALGGSEPSKQ